MPSLNEIYSSLIENPDIQPPEGQDREAYVVDLAKQRLRQYKNNEKALSLGMEKSAIQNFADFILEKSEKTRQMYATFMDDKKLTPERIQSALRTFEDKNPDMAKVKHEDLEQLVEDDDNAKSAYVALRRLQHMLTAPDGKDEEGKPIKLEPPVIAKPGGGFRLNPNRRGISRAAIGGEVVDNLLPPGHPLGMTTKNKEQKDNLKAGKDFDKIKQAYITQEEGTRDLTQAELDLLEEHADLIAENKDLFDEIIEEDDEKRIIENAQKGAKGEISTERDEDSSPDDIDKRNKENLSKVEALQRKLAEDAREQADKQAKSEDAEKQWGAFEKKIKSTLKKHFGKRKEFKGTKWESMGLNDPKISAMIDYLAAEAKEGTKSQKAAVLGIHDAIQGLPNLSESFQDEEKAAAYDNFFSEEEDAPMNKFYKNNPNLTLASDMSDGIRRATIQHFGGDVDNITKEAVADLSDEDLNKIWTDSHGYVTESTKKELNPEDVREKKLSLLERTFPSKIPLGTFKEAYDKYQAEQQKQSLAKVDEGGNTAEVELQKWFRDDTLQHLRDTFGFDNNQLIELAHKEFVRTDGKKGPQGSNPPAWKQIRLNEVDTDTFRDYHKNFLSGTEETTVDNMAGAMREGKVVDTITGKRTKLNFNRETTAAARQFNTWRTRAFEQFIKDAKIAPLASDQRKDIEESFWEQVAEKTGLPLSIVRIGSNENYTEKMRKAKTDSEGKIMTDEKGKQLEGKLETDEEYVASGGVLGVKPVLNSKMKQAIHEAMRSVYLKEMTDRKLPFLDDLIPEDAVPITDYDELEKVDTTDPEINQKLQDHFNQEIGIASKVDDAHIKKLIERNQQYRGQGIDPAHSAQGFLNKIKNNQSGIDPKELRDEIRKEADEHTIFLPPENGLDWNSDDAINEVMAAAGIVDEDEQEVIGSEEPTGENVETDENDAEELEDNSQSAVDELAQKTAERNIAQAKEFDLKSKTKQVFDKTTKDEDRLKILDNIIEEHGQKAVDDMVTTLAQLDLNAAKNNMPQNPGGLNNQLPKVQEALKDKASKEVNTIWTSWLKAKQQIPKTDAGTPPTGGKGGEEPSSEKSNIDKIKDSFKDMGYAEGTQKKIDDASNLKELESAVKGRTNGSIINGVPLQGATLFTAMAAGLFDMEGMPTPRGEKFLDLVGERYSGVSDMIEGLREPYQKEYGEQLKFDSEKYMLSATTLKWMINEWNKLHDDDNQIDYSNKISEDGSEITKQNGDAIDEDHFTKDFTYGDDAPHLAKTVWGEDGDDAGHDIMSRILLAGIVSSRLTRGKRVSDAFEDIMKTGGVARPNKEVTQTPDVESSDEVVSKIPVNNPNNSTSDVEIENLGTTPEELEEETKTPNPQPNTLVVTETKIDTDTEEADTPTTPTVTADKVGDKVETTPVGSGGGGSSQDKTATGSDDGEDDEEEKVTPTGREAKINSLMTADFDDDWKRNMATPSSTFDPEVREQYDHFVEMDDKQFNTEYSQHMKTKSAARRKAKEEAAKAQADADTKAQRAADSETGAEQATLDGMDDESLAATEKRERQVNELIESGALPESAHKYLDSKHPDARSNKEINDLHHKHVVEPSFTPPSVEEDVVEEEPINREQYYQELADYDGIDLEEAKKRYGEDGTFSEDEFKKKIHNMFNKPKAIPEDLDRDGMLDKLAELRDMSREDVEKEFEYHDDKEIRQSLHSQINQKASREAADKKTEEARIGKQNARDANASLKHQFKTPMEVKNEFDPDREGADEDGKMSTSEAADMFRSLLQHASQNRHHYDEAGIERLNELNHNLVRHLEQSPEGLEELDKIHSEVQMATDLDIEYGSQEWYDHLDKTEADRAEKETREREQKEADEAEANRKFDDRETSLDRAFAHPHHKDHSNRLHSFDLEIEIGEDGKPTVTNAEHKGGIHHFEHSDGVVRENEHDAASHRGSGRSEHAPYDPDHTPEQAEIYQKIHAHRQRMDDLESPIRETDRRHSKEKADLQRKFDEASRTRATEHGRKRTRIQDTMHKKHAKITEAYDEEMATLSNDLDEVTLTIQDQMDTLREEKKAEYRELRSRHDRNASTSKERMDASESAINDQHGIHAKELEDLDAEHEQDRADFDAGTGRWDLDEMQRTNPEAAARYADPEQREAVKEEMYNKHASTRAELENTHADRIEGMEAFHAENISSHEETLAQHADEQEEFKRTSKEATEELQKNIVGAKKEIRDKMRDITSTYKEESDKISAKANEDYELHDNYVEGIEAEYQAEHDTNKESLASKHVAERAEAVGSAGSDMIEASRLDGMLREEYLNSAGDDEAARERLTRNLDNSDLGATETSYARHAEEESTRIQGEAQEAAQGMMDDDTPPPGSPSPTNPSLVYKPGPGKNWVTRDSYNAAVAKGLLARDNNSISFSNQGGNIIAHHGTDSWEVSEGVEGKGARTSQEAIGNAIHHGASQWTDEDGTSFADKTAALKEGESFEISHDHFNQHSPALVRGLKGQKPDGTTPTTSDTPTETGETPEEPKESSTSKFLGRMGTKVFSPVAQAIKQQTKTAKQNFANDLRENRWKQNNMFATGEGPSKRYQDGYTWYGKPKNIDPDKDHVGQASLGRELQRFNPFKGQKAKAEISTENQIENQSRAVQALQTHVQGQNSTLRQMGAQSSPTVKPTVGASTQTLKDHVQNKQSTGTTPPAPPA